MPGILCHARCRLHDALSARFAAWLYLRMKTPKARPSRPAWFRHFVYRKESWRTTWKLRLGVLVFAFGILFLTRPFWTVRLAQGLVCTEHAPNSDALLLENFDQDYLVFERAEVLRRSGLASRVLVPITASDGLKPNTVDAETAGVMARVAHLPAFEPIPIQLKEPISLNAAYQIRDFLLRKNVRSVVVVVPGFRSRGSTLVYRTV